MSLSLGCSPEIAIWANGLRLRIEGLVFFSSGLRFGGPVLLGRPSFLLANDTDVMCGDCKPVESMMAVVLNASGRFVPHVRPA